MSRRQWGAGAVAIVASLGLGLLAYEIGTGLEEARARQEFVADGRRARDALERDLLRTASVVELVRSLFDSSVHVDPTEFSTFVRGSLKQHPWIAAIEWAPGVRASELSEHIEQVRRTGSSLYRPDFRESAPDLPSEARRPDYRVTAIDEMPEAVAPGRRATSFPIVYVEPFDSAVLGLDLASESRRAEALMRSVGSGELIMTAPIDLLRDEGGQPRALMFAAVREAPHASPDWVESRLLGVVLAVVRYPDLIAATARDSAAFDSDMHYRVLDTTDAATDSPGTLLADGDEGGPSFTDAVYEGSVLVCGRRFTVQAAPAAAYLSARRGEGPVLAGLTTLLFSLFVGFSFAGALRSARLSVTRDRDAILRSVLTSVAEGVVVVDRDANVIFCNRVAHELLGPIEEIPPLDWTRVCGLYLQDGTTPCPIEQLPLVRGMHGERVESQHMLAKNDEHPEGAWLSISGSPLLDDDDRLQGGIAVIRNISSSKRAEAKMQKLAFVVEQTEDIVIVTSVTGVVTYVNPAFERATGFKSAEVVGYGPELFASGDDQPSRWKSIRARLMAGYTFRGVLHNRRKDGRTFRADHTITPVQDQADGHHYLISVSRDISERVRNQMLQFDMKFAARVQSHLYPQRPPAAPGLEVAGRCFPASSTSGDYFDFVDLPNGAFGLIIADISGCGLGSALLMAETRAYFRSLLATGGSMGAAIEGLARNIEPDLHEGVFVSLLAVEIDANRRALRYYNAGHWPGFVLDSAGGMKVEMQRSGAPLGLSANNYPAASDAVVLQEGDVIVLFTDGVAQARCPDTMQQFGTESALDFVRQNRQEPAEKLVQLLREGVDRFVGYTPHGDDQTIIVCRIVAR